MILVPPVGSLQGGHLVGHGVLEATPRIYQLTPDIPDRRRATKHKESQALARPTAAKKVSSPPVRTIPTASDVTGRPNPNSKPLATATVLELPPIASSHAPT
jgi:hypothetical protein